MGNYFKLLLERKVNEAERELSRIRDEKRIEGGRSSEWREGFLKALEGLLLVQKNPDDKYLFFNKNQFTKRDLRDLRRRFLKHSENELHADYDRGYFSCMAEYAKALEREVAKGES